MPVDINDPAVLAQAQAIAQRDGVPVEFALLQIQGNAPDATPEQYQEFLQAPGPYSRDNLPPDDGVPFNLGPESLNGGLVGAPGSEMGVDPMAGSGNPLLSDGKEGYGHFVDNSFDAGLDRALEKQRNEQANTDQKMADRMAVDKDVYNRQRDEAEQLGMIEPRTYGNLVEQDPTVTGGFRQEEVQVASPTADDPDRTVPVTRVHGGKQMTHSPEDMARLNEMGLSTNALGGTPAYDYIQATDAEGNTTFVNPTLMGKGEESGMLTPHQQKQLETRMNRRRDRSGYTDETQYTPYRKMDGSMGLRIDPNSPEVRQKRKDQMADEASRKQLVKARGMLAGVSPTQNMVNAQMMLMGGDLPGGVGMSDEYRKGMLAQMFPEQAGIEKQRLVTDAERYKARMGLEGTKSEVKGRTDVARITGKDAVKVAEMRNETDVTIEEVKGRNSETIARIESETNKEMQSAEIDKEIKIAKKNAKIAKRNGDLQRAQEHEEHIERLETIKNQGKLIENQGKKLDEDLAIRQEEREDKAKAQDFTEGMTVNNLEGEQYALHPRTIKQPNLDQKELKYYQDKKVYDSTPSTRWTEQDQIDFRKNLPPGMPEQKKDLLIKRLQTYDQGIWRGGSGETYIPGQTPAAPAAPPSQPLPMTPPSAGGSPSPTQKTPINSLWTGPGSVTDPGSYEGVHIIPKGIDDWARKRRERNKR